MTAMLGVEAEVLEQALTWLAAVVDASLRLHFGSPCEVGDIREIASPQLRGSESAFAALVARHQLDFDEQVVLCLAMAPHLRPQLLDGFLVKNPLTDRVFTEFGGVLDRPHEGFRPTFQTAAFVLAGQSLTGRLALQRLFDGDHVFHRARILRFDLMGISGSPFSAILELEPACLARLTHGSMRMPPMNASFPARRVTTDLEWDDLILPFPLLAEINTIGAWFQHRAALAEHPLFGRKIKAGYRALFYGPPGTGKTATACLIGKRLQLDVYRVDLSMIVSKWVGETEKNLAAVFDLAQTREWILFFDEADALFSKRTPMVSSNDRYANQEVSFLLQRIEDYPGLIILASNLKSNLDEAFTRRFQSVIYFGIPSVKERILLWNNILGEPSQLNPAIDAESLAAKFELTGGDIVNVVHYAFLMAMQRGEPDITLADLQQGVRREFQKSGKTV